MSNPDEIAERFSQYKRRIDRELQKAEELKAEAKAIEAKAADQKRRIDMGLPEANACPDCWVRYGETNTVVARIAADPDHFDRWACPKCGFFFDVRF